MTPEPRQHVRLADGTVGTVLRCGDFSQVLVRLSEDLKVWVHVHDLELIE